MGALCFALICELSAAWLTPLFVCVHLPPFHRPSFQDEYEKKKGGKSSRKEEKVDVTGWGDGDDDEASSPPLFCARCFSLTNYGRVKNEVAESRLPDFDIGKKVGQKIRLRRFRRSGLHPWPACIFPVTHAPRTLQGKHSDVDVPRAYLSSWITL